MASGIYAIENKENNRIYIGSSTDLNKRRIEHKFKLSNGVHHNPELQADWEEYGSKNFKFYCIEEDVPKDKLRWRELVNIFDIYWLSDLYNLSTPKDRIVYGIGKCLSNQGVGFVVDKPIYISKKFYYFNLVTDTGAYINLRYEDLKPEKAEYSFALKASYVAGVGGRITEFVYDSDLTDAEIQEIILEAIYFIEGD